MLYQIGIPPMTEEDWHEWARVCTKVREEWMIKDFEAAFHRIWLNDPNIIHGEACIYCGGNWDTPRQEGIPGNHEPDCDWVEVYKWLQQQKVK